MLFYLIRYTYNHLKMWKNYTLCYTVSKGVARMHVACVESVDVLAYSELELVV